MFYRVLNGVLQLSKKVPALVSKGFSPFDSDGHRGWVFTAFGAPK